MPDLSSLVQLRTLTGQPIQAGDVRLTPESQVLQVRLPFGGLVWQRPTAVVVEQAGHTIRRLPIVDLTRIAQLSVLVGTLVLSSVYLIISARHPE